jgi:predicted NBD/HSP70 family sugar kinase
MQPRGLRGNGLAPNRHGQRDRHDRLILSLIQRHGAIAASEIARLSGLPPQLVSVILRQLELDGYLLRGAPQRRRVGKPAIPMMLDPHGAYSFGLRIGRRGAELVLCDFLGRVRGHLQTTYPWPVPDDVLGFLKDGMERLTAGMDPDRIARVTGIGIARPKDIWAGPKPTGAPDGAGDAWASIDFGNEIALFSRLPVFVDNDSTAACRAEQVYGVGRALRDFASFFVGSVIGGGIVLNHGVIAGATGNAAAFGSLPLLGPGGRSHPLNEAASIRFLEEALSRADLDPAVLWTQPQDWSGHGPAFDAVLETWLDGAAASIAAAAVTVCAVIDVEAIIIEGHFPAPVREDLVARINAAFEAHDRRGLSAFRVVAGAVGSNARAIGAASIPLFARHLIDLPVTR